MAIRLMSLNVVFRDSPYSNSLPKAELELDKKQLDYDLVGAIPKEENSELRTLGATFGVTAPSNYVSRQIGYAAASIAAPLVTGIRSILGGSLSRQEILDQYKVLNRKINDKRYSRNVIVTQKWPPAITPGGGFKSTEEFIVKPKMTTEKLTFNVTVPGKGRKKVVNPNEIRATGWNQKNGLGRNQNGKKYWPRKGQEQRGARYVRGRGGKMYKTQFNRQRGSYPRITGGGKIASFQNYDRNSIASVAQTVKPKGNEMVFLPGRRPGNIRIQAKIYLGDLGYANVSGVGLVVWTPDNVNTLPAQWYGAPANFPYMGNGFLPRVGQYFDSYYNHGFIMEYTTKINATGTPYDISWCLCDSPDHWERLGVNTFTQPTSTQILQMTNSQAFPSWTKQQFIYMPPSKQKYSTSAPFPSLYNSNTANIGAVRQTIFGTMGVNIDGALTDIKDGEFKNLGRMFGHFDLEYEDMTGLLVSSPTLHLGSGTLNHPSSKDTELKINVDGKLEVVNKAGTISSQLSKLEIKRNINDFITREESDDGSFERLPRNKKSSSVKSESSYVGKKFDSTKGYPGEGPCCLKREGLIKWCKNALSTDIKFLDSRKRLASSLNDLFEYKSDKKTDHCLMSLEYQVLMNGFELNKDVIALRDEVFLYNAIDNIMERAVQYEVQEQARIDPNFCLKVVENDQMTIYKTFDYIYNKTLE